MNKKDTYRNYFIWGALILFYIVFYLLQNYAWIDEIELSGQESIITSKFQPPTTVFSTDTNYRFEPERKSSGSAEIPTDQKVHRDKDHSFHKSHQSTQSNVIISINHASREQWESLYNIGPYRAEKIIKFRNALGGFYSVDQVGETYAVPDSVFQQIKPFLRVDSNFHHLEINQVVYDSLYPHPYITKQMAYYIAKQRKTKLFRNMEELYEIIPEKDHERLKKLEPYLYFSIR